MSTRFEKMEECMRLAAQSDAIALRRLQSLLADGDWPVRYAAAVALGDRADGSAMACMIEALDREDAAPLYSQEKDLAGMGAGSPRLPAGALPTGLDEATAAAWQRRGRVKQALCLAIGATRNADPEALRRLQRYATDQREDCAVRAAACKALGQLGPPGSRSTLEQAARDGEWCTATEAAKALAALDARAEI